VLDPYIGNLTVQQVHYGTLQPFIRGRLEAGKSPGTVNRDLAVVADPEPVRPAVAGRV
jgi:hypothetical protein